MSIHDVDERLARLRDAIAWPDPRDVSESVATAISSSGRAPARRRSRRTSWTARPVIVVGLLVALTAMVLVVSPAARQAVASLLGVAGVEVRVQDSVFIPTPARFRMGEAVTLRQAQRRVDFPVRQLALDGELHRLGGGVFIDESGPVDIVHILYAQQPGLPYAFSKNLGARLTQFRAPMDGPLFTKEALRGDSEAIATAVNSEPALWVSGRSHVLVPNRDGVPVREEGVLSANVLLWTSDGITYRLETSLELTGAVALAETLHEGTDPP